MGINYLLDTDTFIYLTKGHRRVLEKIREFASEDIKLSAISVAELYFGMHHSQKVSENIKKLETFLNDIEILDFNIKSARTFGRLKQMLFEKRLTVDDFDLAIASVALANDCKVVTHNTNHFNKITELILEDWIT